MTLHSIFSSEYFLYIQKYFFVTNNKASMKRTRNKFQSGPFRVLMKAAAIVDESVLAA